MEDKNLPELVDADQYPDFWTQMQNFQEFLKDVGQGVKEGNTVLVTEEKRLQREEAIRKNKLRNERSKSSSM